MSLLTIKNHVSHVLVVYNADDGKKDVVASSRSFVDFDCEFSLLPGSYREAVIVRGKTYHFEART